MKFLSLFIAILGLLSFSSTCCTAIKVGCYRDRNIVNLNFPFLDLTGKHGESVKTILKSTDFNAKFLLNGVEYSIISKEIVPMEDYYTSIVKLQFGNSDEDTFGLYYDSFNREIKLEYWPVGAFFGIQYDCFYPDSSEIDSEIHYD